MLVCSLFFIANSKTAFIVSYDMNLCSSGVCTNCGLCCIVFSITALQKGRTTCPYLLRTDEGFRCSQYESRPEACRSYLPNLIGVMRVLDGILAGLDSFDPITWADIEWGLKHGGGLDVSTQELAPFIEYNPHPPSTKIGKDRLDILKERLP